MVAIITNYGIVSYPLYRFAISAKSLIHAITGAYREVSVQRTFT